jgi:hypothetical protein
MPTHLQDYYDSLDKTQKTGIAPHRAQIFFEGWAADCECGVHFLGDTKREVMGLHQAHVATHKATQS